MRPFKFRAWDVEEKCWIPQEQLAIDAFGEGILTYEGSQDRWCNETIPYILMQFTGRLDKNGTEIYEGDVVEYGWLIEHGSHETDNSGTGVVQFDEQALEYNIKPLDDREYPSLGIVSDCKVIGNIHENPELVEATP